MKKTLLATSLTLTLCVPVWAAGQFHNNSDSDKYVAPDFGDEYVNKDSNTFKDDLQRNVQKTNKDKSIHSKNEKKAEVVPVRLTADHAEYDTVNGDFSATGNVVIKQGLQTVTTTYANGNMKTGDVWMLKGGDLVDPVSHMHGNWGHYNFNTKTGELKELSGKNQKDYIRAKHATVLPDKIVADEGGVATRCPAVKHPPCMSITAKTIEYYPGDKMIAHNVKVFVHGKHIYSRDVWINEFNGGSQTKIMPRVGYDGKDNGAYIKLQIDQPIDKKNNVNLELTQYSKAGFKPFLKYTHNERNFSIKYFDGWDEDDDHWYKKENDWRFDYKNHHIIDGIPISYDAYYERGLWKREDNGRKSWHSEYAYYIHHDPIYFFNSRNTVLNLTYGRKWVRESYTGDTLTTNMYYATLGQKISNNLRAWVGYYRENITSSLFDIGQPDMEREWRVGLQYNPTRNDIFTIVNRYDDGKHKNYETDYRWFHRFCCWALELSYEKEQHDNDNSFKVHYYFYNW